MRTRFAPAPTGYLHLGHVASALHVWGIARYVRATVILRIEDHDQGRSQKVYEQSILDDLAWLGLAADQGVLDSQSPSKFRQSDCLPCYEDYLAKLRQAHRVYPCYCSRKSIQNRLASFGGEVFYPGFCLPEGQSPADLDIESNWRLHLPNTLLGFEDRAVGPQQQAPWLQCGDLLIRDRSGHWSYHFSTVVDDIEQGIHLTIRGLDLLPSVGRQLLLRSMLGANEAMTYVHHPLILDDQGNKLAKRARSMSLQHWREAGFRAEDVIGKAAYQSGMIETSQALSLQQFYELINE